MKNWILYEDNHIIIVNKPNRIPVQGDKTGDKTLLDLVKEYKGNVSDAFKKIKVKFFIISFTSDWLYPTGENKEIVIALNACGANVGFVEINSDKGHDSFLLDVPEFLKTVKEFLNSTYNEIQK